jgi:hypothetical protein
MSNVICPNCENNFNVTEGMQQEGWVPAFCTYCGHKLDMTYDYLKQYVIKAQNQVPINLGAADDLIQNDEQLIKIQEIDAIELNEEDDLILYKIEEFEIYVQPYNHHYEIKFENGTTFDLAFDSDKQLQESIIFMETLRENELMKK